MFPIFPNVFWMAVGWGSGLLLYYLPLAGKVYVGLLVLCMVLGLLYERTHEKRNHGFVFLCLLVVVGFGWGFVDEHRHQSDLLQMFTEFESVEEVRMIGRIDSEPVVDGDRVRFFFKGKEVFVSEEKVRKDDNGLIKIGTKVKERLWVTLALKSEQEKENAYHLTRGDQVELTMSLQLPEGPRNPGAFHFPRYLWSQYSVWMGQIDGLEGLTVIKHSTGWRFISTLRNYLEVQMDHLFSEENAGVLKGMLLGDRVEVSADMEEVYRRTGILHILAISGFHVGVVISGLLFLLIKMGVTRERAFEIVLLFIPFYMLLTGLSPSVTRAGIMGIIYLLAKRSQVNYSGIKSISLAFIIMTLFHPRDLFHIGFQLSFGITLGLLLFTEPVMKLFQERFNLPSKTIAGALTIPIVAQVISFPLLVAAFHQISFISFLINLLVIPLFVIFIPWGYLSLLIGTILPPLGKVVAFPLDGILEILHQLLNKISLHPNVVTSIVLPPSWWLIIYVALFLLILWSPNHLYLTPDRLKQLRWTKRIGVIILLLLLSIPYFTSYFQSDVRITFIDVGQGDSMLIQGPGKRSVLIDGGGEGFYFEREQWQIRRNPFEVGKDIVLPTLRGLGVSHIDWMVMTHGHSDHYGGLREVVEKLAVKYVLVNGRPPSSPLEEELITAIQEKGIPIYIAVPGQWMTSKQDVSWSIVAGNELLSVKNSENDASIVLLLTAYGRDVLFTGDLEAAGEDQLRSLWESDQVTLNIDILKVGHHGSTTSTTAGFLEITSPNIAIISAGRNNLYGHPRQEVLDRLDDFGVEVYRTDLHGAITFVITKRGEIKVKTWAEGIDGCIYSPQKNKCLN